MTKNPDHPARAKTIAFLVPSNCAACRCGRFAVAEYGVRKRERTMLPRRAARSAGATADRLPLPGPLASGRRRRAMAPPIRANV